MDQKWEWPAEGAETEWDVKHVKAHRIKKEKKAMTKELKFAVEGDELARGAEADVGKWANGGR